MTGRHALWSGLHQQAENIEAVVLGQSGQGREASDFSIFQRILK